MSNDSTNYSAPDASNIPVPPTQPYQAPAQPGYPYAQGAPYGATGAKNQLALVSMITGIAGLLFVTVLAWLFNSFTDSIGGVISLLSLPLAITAIVTGHIALGKIKRTGEQGKGMAITGVVTGYVTIGWWIFSILLVAILFASIFGGLR